MYLRQQSNPRPQALQAVTVLPDQGGRQFQSLRNAQFKFIRQKSISNLPGIARLKRKANILCHLKGMDLQDSQLRSRDFHCGTPVTMPFFIIKICIMKFSFFHSDK